MFYSIDDYEEHYTEKFDSDEHGDILIQGLKKYRVKTIKAGKFIEYECYPLWSEPPKKRAEREKESKPSQKSLNDKNRQKYVRRLINANFTDKDTWATFTYDKENEPESYKQAKNDMRNYLRRLKRKLEKIEGHPELKYIYVTEFNNELSNGKVRIHHHIILNVADRDLIENEWKCGARTQARRLQADELGYEGLARYITKDPYGKKNYTPSRNLKKPSVSISDYKLSRRKAQNLVMNQNDAPEIFEKMNNKYRFIKMEMYVSDYIGGVYIHATLRLRE